MYEKYYFNRASRILMKKPLTLKIRIRIPLVEFDI
jgi:hypothetical protein